MRDHWLSGKLGDFITLQRGVDITQKKMIEGEVPVVSSSGITGYHNQAIAQPPGVITGRKGLLGKIYYVDKPYWPHDTTLWVKDFKGNYPRFVYYFLKTLDFLNMDVGSSNPTLNRNHVHPIRVMFPPPNEQREIAAILGALDDKIDLNRRMNATLEATARALFQSWFVDFDPVRAKAEGRQPEGMDAETAALFPDGFEESALGWIPTEWRIGTFSTTVEIIGGGTPKTSVAEYWDGDILWFSVKDVPSDSDVFVINTEKRITQAGVENSSTRLLPELTSIISARGTVGKLALTGVPMAMNQSCYAIRGASEGIDYFTFFHLRSLIMELLQRTHGTVFDTITRETFSTIATVIPPLEIAQTFDRAVQPLLSYMRNNLFETRTLAETRDALLPKLISGQVRVGDVKLENEL